MYYAYTNTHCEWKSRGQEIIAITICTSFYECERKLFAVFQLGKAHKSGGGGGGGGGWEAEADWECFGQACLYRSDFEGLRLPNGGTKTRFAPFAHPTHPK